MIPTSADDQQKRRQNEPARHASTPFDETPAPHGPETDSDRGALQLS
jgi:hypothetical protein